MKAKDAAARVPALAAAEAARLASASALIKRYEVASPQERGGVAKELAKIACAASPGAPIVFLSKASETLLPKGLAKDVLRHASPALGAPPRAVAKNAAQTIVSELERMSDSGEGGLLLFVALEHLIAASTRSDPSDPTALAVNKLKTAFKGWPPKDVERLAADGIGGVFHLTGGKMTEERVRAAWLVVEAALLVVEEGGKSV